MVNNYNTVGPDGLPFKITVTTTQSFNDNVLTELMLSCNFNNGGPPIVGLSVDHSDGDDKTTLILSTKSQCLVIEFHSSNAHNVPRSLKNFLSASLFCFLSIGMCDIKWACMMAKLEVKFGIDCKNALNLNVFPGLKSFSDVLGDWNVIDLSEEHVKNVAGYAQMVSEIGDSVAARLATCYCCGSLL